MLCNLTHFSLFSGIGGLDLAAEWAGFKTIGQCEQAEYPTKILKKHWPDTPRWEDINGVTQSSFYEKTGLRTCTLISGGFPCQGFSVAGKQKGKEDPRYLWPAMLRVITEIAPRWVVAENVSGILRIAGRDICEDMERAGYSIAVFNYEAAAVGAPHRRERVFFVAHARSRRFSESDICAEQSGRTKAVGTGTDYTDRSAVKNDGVASYADRDHCRSRRTKSEGQQRQTGAADGSKDVGHSDHYGSSAAEITGGIAKASGNDAQRKETSRQSEGASGRSDSETVANSASGEDRRLRQRWVQSDAGTICFKAVADTAAQRLPISQFESRFNAISENHGAEHGSWWATEPDVGRVAYGIPCRVDRLRCLGNAVVPHQAYPVFKAIAEIEQ